MTTQVDDGSLAFKAALQVLATCPALKRLDVNLAFSVDARERVYDLFAVDLPHVDRTIALLSWPDQHCSGRIETRHHFFKFPAGAPLFRANFRPCLSTILSAMIAVVKEDEI